jgi:hypothetical protein
VVDAPSSSAEVADAALDYVQLRSSLLDPLFRLIQQACQAQADRLVRAFEIDRCQLSDLELVASMSSAVVQSHSCVLRGHSL